MTQKITPRISILIPTLNASAVLEKCLKSIDFQDYPKDKIEIIVADGGSTDMTLKISADYGAIVVENKLKTGEAGKMAALKHATGEYVALIDSDNELPDKEWFNQMITPLEKHQNAVGSEPWKYTWRSTDGFITRYSALTGVNDPFMLFLGNYDRVNMLTGTWTGVAVDQQDFGDYLVVKLTHEQALPTIGANGTIFRREFLLANCEGDYLFDIDILQNYLSNHKYVEFIKVKNGIIHSFCESDVSKFIKKQRRRIKDYTFFKHQNLRKNAWTKPNTVGYAKFILSCVTILPLVYQSIRGYLKFKDTAWFFHILACEITLYEYAVGVIVSKFKSQALDRKDWRQ